MVPWISKHLNAQCELLLIEGPWRSESPCEIPLKITGRIHTDVENTQNILLHGKTRL